jgi:hypothetical protein
MQTANNDHLPAVDTEEDEVVALDTTPKALPLMSGDDLVKPRRNLKGECGL